jgi:hypothetical protein
MWSRSFQEMGIPPGYGFKQLLFSPAAKAVVVQAQSAGKSWRPERLYFRHVGEEKYASIGPPAELVSQEFPFVHPSKPLLAYNCLKHHFSLDAQGEERHSADWHSLNLYDLDSGVEVDSINPETLTLPAGIVRGWISTIVAFSDSGLFVQRRLVQVQRFRTVRTGRLVQGKQSDGLRCAEVGLPQHVLTPVVALPATFM